MSTKNQPDQPQDYSLSVQELVQVEAFIQRRNTAVVTTMFTDIKGFTEITESKGDTYAQSLRQAHDEILTRVIEKDGQGKVIKFIGDAVMAIFSEPSAAVVRALQIQREVATFNRANADFEDLSVRIGLHMGQVAVEERVQADVFGRHVNRAARIESLADGGQVFLTYPVFDSAKGWLESEPNLEWKLHGAWYVKGIDEPVQVYEVFDPTLRQPQAPKGGRKVRVFPKALTSVLLLVVGAALAFGWLYF
ncbi:MAG: adenylate/guanylate cyclase domain-containing protein, partial [Limnobacter sp.]|nr:adenylate/guanylate cyclase domain-containing protein [Limnobacter sp.]